MKVDRELLERVAARVLADAAFLFAEPLLNDPPRLDRWTASGARMRFAGSLKGYIEIWVPGEVARTLAANMFGQEHPDSEEAFSDAMMETLNVICGNLLAEVGGRDPVFQLGTPSLRGRLLPFSEGEKGIDAWLEAEGHPLLLRVMVSASKTQAA